jgi:hypothetical protein
MRLKQNQFVTYRDRTYKVRLFDVRKSVWLINGPRGPVGHPIYHAYVRDDDPEVKIAAPELIVGIERRFPPDYNDFDFYLRITK